MTDTDIQEIAKRVLELDAKATPGPWSVDDSPYSDYTWGPKQEMISDDCPHCASYRLRGHGGGLPQKENATSIAMFRTAAPDLARHVLRLSQENERLTDAVRPDCERVQRPVPPRATHKESGIWDTSCGMVSYEDQPFDPFCSECGLKIVSLPPPPPHRRPGK
jgi:hypothetical protein